MEGVGGGRKRVTVVYFPTRLARNSCTGPGTSIASAGIPPPDATSILLSLGSACLPAAAAVHTPIPTITVSAVVPMRAMPDPFGIHNTAARFPRRRMFALAPADAAARHCIQKSTLAEVFFRFFSCALVMSSRSSAAMYRIASHDEQVVRSPRLSRMLTFSIGSTV